MFDQGIAATKLVFAVVLNTVGLAALLTAAWFIPQVLSLFVGGAGPQG